MDPNPATHNSADPAAFIARWQKSGAAERANYPPRISELMLDYAQKRAAGAV